jgi:SAM-dependent methyltransferase
MDIWKYYGVTHTDHVFCNPMSGEKFDRLIRLLRLPPGARVLEVASGKGEFLARLAEAYGIAGVGVDISPYFVADARAKFAQRVPDADVALVEMDGAKYELEDPETFDLTACIGASWIFKGHRSTLEFLVGATAPGGWIVVGEAYWLKEPETEYIEASGDDPSDFGTHAWNAAVGEDLGLELVHTLVSSRDDWDEYEGLQWYATANYARSHPDDPDVPEIVSRVAKARETYLRWGRDTLGWALYAFRKPAA